VMKDVITIDGPAGSGKSTVSRRLAKRIQALYLDTGAMYRAVALAAKRQGIHLNDGTRLRELCSCLDLHFKMDEAPPRLFLDGEDISLAIRSPEMDMASSKVSAVREVREAMTELQRKMAMDMRLVAEGRDMGTVVFPDAKHKFFLTASLKVRAERRYRELLGRGEGVPKALVESELKKRDHQDETRPLAPLRPAEDAKLIDSTLMTPEEVIMEILSHLNYK
jgi:cytidylate kinase